MLLSSKLNRHRLGERKEQKDEIVARVRERSGVNFERYRFPCLEDPCIITALAMLFKTFVSPKNIMKWRM